MFLFSDIGDLESLPSTHHEKSNMTVGGADTVVLNTCHGTDLVDSLQDYDDDQTAREEQVDRSATTDQRVDSPFATEQQVDSLSMTDQQVDSPPMRDQHVDSVHGRDSEAEVNNSDRLDDVRTDNDEPQPGTPVQNECVLILVKQV